jgi:hypothetical protein
LILFSTDFERTAESLCGQKSSVQTKALGPLANAFDCASQPPFNQTMLSAVAGALIILSMGILVAHVMDIYRSTR